MKEGFIHVCFIIDESGSMYESTEDVLGGFKRIIDEQKAVKDGTCAVSLFTFNDDVKEVYLGRDINELDGSLDYRADNMTAMNDGIGIAITRVGKWLSNMKEEDRPEKNLIVIMTDGYENASVEYTTAQVRAMIKDQTEKYGWSFMYLGTDITDTKYADSIGVASAASTRAKYSANYMMVNNLVSNYRNSKEDHVTKNSSFLCSMNSSLQSMNDTYAEETGINVKASK